MKNKLWILIFIFVSLAFSSCSNDGRFQLTVITEGEQHLTGTTFGDLIMLGGNTTIEPDAVLEGSAHLLSGQLDLQGKVTGNVSIFNGELSFGPDGEIEGNLNQGGGELTDFRRSAVGGKINASSGVNIPQAPAAAQAGNALGTAARWLISAILIGLAGASVDRYLPQRVRRIGNAAANHLPAALAAGILVGIAGLTLLILMAYTIVLIPVTLIGGMLLTLAVILGWISLTVILGCRAAQLLKSRPKPRLTAFSSSAIFMLCLQGLSVLPYLGGLLGLTAASIGLGAVYLTQFGRHRFIPEFDPNPSE
jgi:hypothetical protein